MLKSQINQLIASGKFSLIVRVVFLTLVVLTSLMGAAPAFADPAGGITGG
jgi:hypothetical protein